MFSELGPWYPNAQGTLDANPYSWNTVANVIFLGALHCVFCPNFGRPLFAKPSLSVHKGLVSWGLCELTPCTTTLGCMPLFMVAGDWVVSAPDRGAGH